MKITITLPDAFVETFIKDVMQNVPECSQSLECVRWHYDECHFTFEDYEDHKMYELDLPKLMAGYEKMMKALLEDKTLLLTIDEESFTDAGQWDADCVDALIQFSLFGAMIYN